MTLATQRREYELAQFCEQLTLELAIISEQKTANVIQLLKKSRRENPQSFRRTDHEAQTMSQPTNPPVLEAIKQTHAEFDLERVPARQHPVR